MNVFIVTRENRQDNTNWPEWMNKAWSKKHTEVGAIYPAEFPDSDGTDPLFLCTEDGAKLILWGDALIEDNGIITLYTKS